MDHQLIHKLSQDIKKRLTSTDADKIKEVEAFLLEELKAFDINERINIVEKIIGNLDRSDLKSDETCEDVDDQVLSRIYSLLLGRNVTKADLSSSEIIEKLAASLNTIFNSLNQLISSINMTFSGESSGEGTIRQVIGFHIEGEKQSNSLENYLGKINNAFLATQKAFKDSAYNKVEQILHALDPESIAAENGKSLKFGPLKKAEYYELYEHKYNKIRRWFESGKFMEDFLREFEKNCQKNI